MGRKQPARTQPEPAFRSGAVARMAQMPVATLRIWEQRYNAVGPITAPSGHRLYSATDVQRLLLLRQLTGQGHAIGALAGLDAAQLQQLAETPPGASAAQRVEPGRRASTLRVAIVGRALALRLQRPAVARCMALRWQVVAVFESFDDAARGAAGAPAGSVAQVDLMLWQSPGLQANDLPELKAAAKAWHAGHVAVAYRFAGEAARQSFTGISLAREPADDDALGTWLASLEASASASADTPHDRATQHRHADPALGDVAPRRFDDAALTAFAGLASNVACECPRHVAELLMQLSTFETYSGDCADRDPADAELHAYLQRVAGVTRVMFESALERVARHEGLKLS